LAAQGKGIEGAPTLFFAPDKNRVGFVVGGPVK
jgi:hypothetical protein